SHPGSRAASQRAAGAAGCAAAGAAEYRRGCSRVRPVGRDVARSVRCAGGDKHAGADARAGTDAHSGTPTKPRALVACAQYVTTAPTAPELGRGNDAPHHAGRADAGATGPVGAAAAGPRTVMAPSPADLTRALLAIRPALAHEGLEQTLANLVNEAHRR